MNANLSANEQGSLAKTSYGRHRHSELKWQRVCIFTNGGCLLAHVTRYTQRNTHDYNYA